MSSYFGSIGTSDGVVETPDWIWDSLKSNWKEIYDPCPVDPKVDGLIGDFPDEGVTYVNPPYNKGQIGIWAKKVMEQGHKGKRIVMLIPSYTDTKYFHDFIYQQDGCMIKFIRGRIKFKGYKQQYPSPMMFVCWNCDFYYRRN
jgi:site-specific DNA-methyltransferase (adenine-specific)